MKNTVFTGMATAIITPMNKDGIDYENLGRLIEFQIEKGINAIVVMGTTGENATIEPEDQKKVIAYTVEKVAKRVPVIAGAGTNNTEHVLANTKAVFPRPSTRKYPSISSPRCATVLIPIGGILSMA